MPLTAWSRIGSAGVAGLLSTCRGNDDRSERQAPAAVTPGSAPAVVEPKRGGALKVGDPGEPPTLDPHLGSRAYEYPHYYLIYDRLINYDERGQQRQRPPSP